MIEALKKLIVKHGGTYDRYDNTELDLLRALCNTLGLEYTKYMDESELFNLVAEKGIVPSGGSGESGGSSGENIINPIGVSPTIPWRTTIYKVVNISMEVE